MKKLAAGNWKMNGTWRQPCRNPGPGRSASRARPATSDLPACDIAVAPVRGCRFCDRNRWSGLPRQCLGRPYRRHLGRNDRRCGRLLRHRRPFRTAHRSRRNRCDRPRQGRSRLAGRSDRDRLRGRNPGGTRGRQDAGIVGAGDRLGPRGRDGGKHGRRLRTGLGHRHGQGADAGGNRRGPRRHPRPAEGPFRKTKPTACACFTADRSNPRTRTRFSPCPTWMAPLWAARP